MLKRLIVILLAILGIVFLTILFLGCGSSKNPTTVLEEPNTVVIVVEPDSKPIIVREKSEDKDDDPDETESDSASDKPVDKKKSRAEKIREMRSKRDE